jgi:hypothetical protein
MTQAGAWTPEQAVGQSWTDWQAAVGQHMTDLEAAGGPAQVQSGLYQAGVGIGKYGPWLAIGAGAVLLLAVLKR